MPKMKINLEINQTIRMRKHLYLGKDTKVATFVVPETI